MEISPGYLQQLVADFMLPFIRIAAMLMVMPMIGTRLVPVRVRLGLAVALTAVVAPNLPPMPHLSGMSAATWIVIAYQFLIGAVLGFTLNLLFETFSVAGQLTANQMGLGFASMADPVNGTSVVVLGQFYLMIVMLLFLAMNGHLLMIDILVKSFTVLPVSMETIPVSNLWRLVIAGSWLFSAGLLIALPAITAMLVVNFAFGIMTKAAPQLNIFAIGFPMTMVLGLFIVHSGLGGIFEQYQRVSHMVLGLIASLLTKGASGG